MLVINKICFLVAEILFFFLTIDLDITSKILFPLLLYILTFECFFSLFLLKILLRLTINGVVFGGCSEAGGATLSFPSCRPYLVSDYFSNKSCKYLITIFP